VTVSLLAFGATWLVLPTRGYWRVASTPTPGEAPDVLAAGDRFHWASVWNLTVDEMQVGVETVRLVRRIAWPTLVATQLGVVLLGAIAVQWAVRRDRRGAIEHV
jgi:hypothetical protein